jgi:hypothetical protein
MQPTYGTMPPPPPAPGPQRYGRIVAIVLAPFFSRGLYRDVARNWRGIGALYLLLLLAVTWAAVMVKLHISVTTSARDEFPKFANDIPPITIKDAWFHRRSTSRTRSRTKTREGSWPCSIPPARSPRWTTRRHRSPDAEQAALPQVNRNQTETTDLSQVKSFYLDRERVVSWVNTGAKWLAPGLYIPAVLGSLAFRLVQALIYGAIGLALASMFDVRLSFAAAMRLAVIAVTPVILLDTIFSLTGIDIPFWTLAGDRDRDGVPGDRSQGEPRPGGATCAAVSIRTAACANTTRATAACGEADVLSDASRFAADRTIDHAHALPPARVPQM